MFTRQEGFSKFLVSYYCDPGYQEGSTIGMWIFYKIGGMWNLKHKIISPKFYEILIKTQLKGDNSLELKYSTNTSRGVSMRWIDSEKTSILLTSP